MCLTPVVLKKTGASTDGYATQSFPCGKCLECRQQRTNSWFVRLSEELKISSSAYFVTLTYQDGWVPYSDNGLMTLDYRDFQLFMKRVRWQLRQSSSKIKYFLVGEYGSNTHRPHYHMIIFNVDNINVLVNEWQLGFVHVGDVSPKSIYYTLKYCTKSILDSGPKDKDDDRKPEKALMSKGLGLSHLTEAMVKYYNDDVTRTFPMLGGGNIALPRYYRDKIFDDLQKVKRLIGIGEYLEERYKRISDPLFPQRVQKMYNRVYEKLKLTD